MGKCCDQVRYVVNINHLKTKNCKNRKTTTNLCIPAANFMSVTKDFWETIPIFHLFIPFQFWPSTRHQVRQLHKENIRQHTKTLQIVPPYQTWINKTHLSLKKYKVHFPFQRGHYHCLLNFSEVSEESTLQFLWVWQGQYRFTSLLLRWSFSGSNTLKPSADSVFVI